MISGAVDPQGELALLVAASEIRERSRMQEQKKSDEATSDKILRSNILEHRL